MKGWINEDGLYCLECPFCKKVICGINSRQTNHNMEIHLKFCKVRKIKSDENVSGEKAS